MSEVLRFTVEYEPPDETGAIVARVREVPSALSFGRTREEARANVLDALKLMLCPEPGTSDEDTLDVPLVSRRAGTSSGRKSAVPRHKDVPPWLVRAICKQLGVDPPLNLR